MRRSLLAIVLVLVSSDVVSAEPISWPFYTRLQAADSARIIALGSEPWSDTPDGPSTLYYFSYETCYAGSSRIGFINGTGTQELYSFGFGWWNSSSVPPDPATTVDNAFVLYWGLDGSHFTHSGMSRGSIAVVGVFTSGTGNTRIELDESHDFTLDGHRTRVRFHSENNESVSRILMTVSELDPVNTPEPTTAIIAAIGLAGLGLYRRLG